MRRPTLPITWWSADIRSPTIIGRPFLLQDTRARPTEEVVPDLADFAVAGVLLAMTGVVPRQQREA